jgi:hypothetical protein
VNARRSDITSIADDNSCALTHAGSMNNTNPQLLPIANNGGPTASYKPAKQSPAVDHADMALCPLVDQRASVRPVGGGCDVGSIEIP